MQHVEPEHEAPSTKLDPVVVEAWFPRNPSAAWSVVSLRGVEAISRPYELELELFSDDPSVDPDEALLGADCEILFDRVGVVRAVYGIIAAVELVTRSEAHALGVGLSARVRLVPALRLLEQVVDTRSFTGQTVPQILREVLTPALADYEREVDCESQLEGSYNRRDYCVQFRESTLAFCSRLMEEEGIAYVFVADEEAQREKLILIDNNEDFEAVELLVPGPVPLILTRPEEHERESAQAFDWRSTRTPNRVVTRGYNPKSPRPLDEGHAERVDAQRHVARTVRLDGERRQITDDPVDDPEAQGPFTGEALDQRASLATRALQRHSLESATGLGRSNAVGFAAGGVFRLGEHPVPSLAGREYLLVEVWHEATRSDRSGGHVYTNRFECVPRERPFRPAPRTQRPRVDGVQRAVVVGPVENEVYTDPFGRVQVRFQHGHGDSSCWILVTQSWAGPGYGAMVIPRVGMEVVVSFVDGNPDCPIVTGCVYNGANTPPYALPTERTKTSFKTCSSPDGGGFNELRFEDAQGSEQIFVRAQGRMDLRVRGSLYETVGGSREERVGGIDELWDEPYGDHNTLVHEDVNHHIGSSRYTKVDKEQYTSVGEDLVEDLQGRHMVLVGELSQLSATRIVVEASEYISHKADDLELAGSSMISVKGGGKVIVESHNTIELRVGASFISISPEGVDIQGLTVRLNSGGGTGLATEGIPALAVDLLEPLDALAADDGSCGRAGSGARKRAARSHESRTLEPHHAPPMKPPPPRPWRLKVLQDGSAPRFSSIGWIERAIYCSEPATVRGLALDYAPGDSELLTLTNAVDGAVQRSFVITPGEGDYEHSVDVRDILPRRTMAGCENHRMLLASAGGRTTLVPLRLRFLSTIAQTWYQDDDDARFGLTVEDGEIIVGGTIYYVYGWLHELIALADTVPGDTGGIIGGEVEGSTDWRYCKRGEGKSRVYWDGATWNSIPIGWVKTEQNLTEMAVWLEGEAVKQQYGTLEWPDSDLEWPDFLKRVAQPLIEAERQTAIEEYWSRRFDIKRQDCRSHDPQCCRYRVHCRPHFRRSEVLRNGGIILHPNTARSNANVWPLWPGDDDEERTWAHEFGHHLGNPDEYEGAATVDPRVNGDGAIAGIDDRSIMGRGAVVRRRHYQTICEALTELVEGRTGREFMYVPVTVLQP